MALVKTNDSEFESILTQNDKVIVKYYADWCGSCKLVAPKYRRLSEDAKYEGISFLDINAEENELARKKAGVTNLPYFAVFKGGELIGSVCASKEESIVGLLEKLS